MSRKPARTNDERAAAARAKADAAYRRQILDDFVSIVEDARGRRFLARLIFDTCGVMYSQPWTPSADIHRQAGRREVGEQILKDMETFVPQAAKVMTTEWFDARRELVAAVEQATTTDEET